MQQKELQKKSVNLLNDVAMGAWGLKLPENRLFIMSEAAGLLWSFDEKRARTLYWDALNSLSLITSSIRNSGQKLSKEEQIKVLQSYLSSFELRQKLVRQVAQKDAQLALEMLRASRQVPPRQVSVDFPLPNDLELEQGIAAEIAGRDPEQALQMARQSLAKGITFEVLNLWQQLSQVDPEKGAQFAGEVIAKLRTINLASDFRASTIAIQLLQSSRTADSDQPAALVVGAPPGKPLRLDSEQKRDLVDVLVNAALAVSASHHVLVQIRGVLPEIEQFFPERRAAIERKLASFDQMLSSGERVQSDFNSLVSGGTPEEIVRTARTTNDENRLMFYYQAASAAVAQGTTDSFRELVSKEISSDDERTKVLDFLDAAEISTAAGLKQLDRLQKLMPKIRGKAERAQAMGELALMLNEEGKDEEAAAMLDEASTLIKADLKDEKQTNALLTLLCAYAVIDPAKAFALAERTVDRANSQISLLLLLDKVVRTGAVRKNEILLQQPNLMPLDILVFKYGKGVAALAKADFNRTRALAERFERNELRLMAQLMMLKGLLDPEVSSMTTTTVLILPK